MRVRQAQVLTTQHFRPIGPVTVKRNGRRIIEFTGRGSAFVGDRKQQVSGQIPGLSRVLCVTDKCCLFLLDR
ncbi:hypothetical protein Enr13x_25440 [Stieleria neptunia]|uniref:Uncharacterized protein n=1 Tax=Stieleria neptunia TaxID=2527979 RepID=A0A518HPC3_9BACT|nr:hypothetical protein Enr13x_25440 [Stieleria neptunia]